MIVVTGGVGFIGSALIHGLNAWGFTDIIVVDDFDNDEKNKNIELLKYSAQHPKDSFLDAIRSIGPIETIFHMGACSSTTETDEVFLRKNNFEYTRDLAIYCLENKVRFIYASSAATYGDGEQGYADDESRLEELSPLNLYGESKHQFDLWAKEHQVLNEIVGLKYFNVYGPNEYHKEDMQSLVRNGFFQARDANKIRLFKSYKPEYADGAQERDFLYIKDAVAMTLYFHDQQKIGGLFNVGSGVARNWNDLAAAVFHAMGLETHIEYMDMPSSIRDQYQYHTCADTQKIRSVGYNAPFFSLEDGIEDYVKKYLIPGKRLGQ